MNIPDKAVEAAANAMVSASPDLSGWGDLNQAEIDWYMRDAREAVAAAAPFIAAQALRDASRGAMSYEEDGGLRPDEYSTGRYDLMWDVQEWLDTRADELDPQ